MPNTAMHTDFDSSPVLADTVLTLIRYVRLYNDPILQKALNQRYPPLILNSFT